MKVVSERTRGLGIGFERIRRITGYIVGDMKYWNNAKKSECMDRVKHAQ
ncbi:MAG: anaerobic ribonucleoside-triphosphate reductase [Methanosphaera sp.]|nr:anaerobic ribonucleoside-triphosphate reductase [Methanosphaera sp.]